MSWLKNTLCSVLAYLACGLTLDAFAADGQPELTIINQQGSAPVTDIYYWITDNTGTIDCVSNQATGIKIPLATHITTIFKKDMAPACQASSINAYVLHVHGDFNFAWNYTTYPKSGQTCTALHDKSGLFFTTIHLNCL